MLRILIADDHMMFRDALKQVLAHDKDFLVVGETATAQAAVELAAELAPDIVLMDIELRGLSSFDATRAIKQRLPNAKVLFVSMHDERDYVRAAMQSGASGYLLKDTAAAELMKAIRTIAGGGSYMTRMLTRFKDGVTTATGDPACRAACIAYSTRAGSVQNAGRRPVGQNGCGCAEHHGEDGRGS